MLLIVLKCISTLTLLESGSAQLEPINRSGVRDSVNAVCLINFINKYIRSDGQSIKLVYDAEADNLIEHLHLSNIPIQILNAQIKKYTSFRYYWDASSNYILYINNIKSMQEMVSWLSQSLDWNDRAKYFVIAVDSTRGSNKVNSDMIKALRHQNVLNITTALLNSEGDFTFYTWRPYAKNNFCGKKEFTTKIGNCTSIKKDVSKMLVIPKNLNKCLFKIGWTLYPPPYRCPPFSALVDFCQYFNLTIR